MDLPSYFLREASASLFFLFKFSFNLLEKMVQ